MPVLDVVLALYSFTSQNEEELSFQKGERLEILDRPANDPDWCVFVSVSVCLIFSHTLSPAHRWLARGQFGKSGLVPKNYVQILSEKEMDDEPTAGPSGVQNDISKLVLANGSPLTSRKKAAASPPDCANVIGQDWYFGSVPRTQCDTLLNEFGEDGDFLVRASETNSGDFSISLKAPGRNKHFRVHFEDGVYCIGQRRFTSMVRAHRTLQKSSHLHESERRKAVPRQALCTTEVTASIRNCGNCKA